VDGDEDDGSSAMIYLYAAIAVMAVAAIGVLVTKKKKA
jgi:LPXTG-motif cell wall-anchored protein